MRYDSDLLEIKEAERKKTPLKTSVETFKKTNFVEKMLRFSETRPFFGKDQMTLKHNTLMVSSTIHYKVLLALKNKKR